METLRENANAREEKHETTIREMRKRHRTALKTLSVKAQELAVGQTKYTRELQREHEAQTRQLRLDLADARRALSEIRISSMGRTKTNRDTKRTGNEDDIENTEDTMAIDELDHSTDEVVEEIPILPSGQDLLSSTRRVRRHRSRSSSSSSRRDCEQKIASTSKKNQGELNVVKNLMRKIENEEKSLKRT